MKIRKIAPGPTPPSGAGDNESVSPAKRPSPFAVSMPLRSFSNAPSPVGPEASSTPPTTEPSQNPHLVEAEAVEPAPDTVNKHSVGGLGDGSYYARLDARMIVANSHPPRQLYSNEIINGLYNSLKEHGQRDAVHVIPHPTIPDRYIIGDGWTRVQAIVSYNLFDNQVYALVHPNLSEEEASWLGYHQNEDRNPPTDFDRAVYYGSWLAKGMPFDKVAEMSGVSKSLLTFYKAFLDFPAELSVFTKNNSTKITANVAYQVGRVLVATNESTALNLANRFVSGDHSHRWLKEQVEAIVAKSGLRKRNRSPSNSVIHKRVFGSGEYRQRSNGSVEIAVKIPEDRNTEFINELDAFLAKYIDIHAPPQTGPTDPDTKGSDPQ